jgi:hypothetical protein
MFGAMGRTPAINGGMRGSRGDDDDDDDDDDGGASFKRDAISLDQVGFVTQSLRHPESAESYLLTHRFAGSTNRNPIGLQSWSSRLIRRFDWQHA